MNGKTLIILLTMVWLLIACATPTQTGYAPPANISDAAARVQVAEQEYANVAAQSTQQAAAQTAVFQSTRESERIVAAGTAAVATQQWQATADSLTVQQTQAAISVNATVQAISANATGTAVAQIAIVEAQLVADEATRLANQRTAEMNQIMYEQRMNQVKPWLYGGIVATFLIIVVVFALRFVMMSRPVRNEHNGVIALPSNRYQIIPNRITGSSKPEPEEPLLLPPPSTHITLPQITSGHVLLAATTGGGKTICLRELVDMRGNNVVVIDPHYTPGAWGQAKVVSGSYGQMSSYLEELGQELEKRIQARLKGQRHFDDLTVATEEMPALVDNLGRGILGTWKRVMREGRKFSIFMMVVSQSTRVKSLGIEGEGDLLDNFNYVIELGKNAAESCPDLTTGMERPAIIRSGHRPPQSIIIPYDPRKDSESDQFVPFFPFGNQGALAAPPINNLAIGPQPINTKYGIISPHEIAQIMDMHHDGASQRSIETAVFGHTGGSAYHKVNTILEKAATNATNGLYSRVQ